MKIKFLSFLVSIFFAQGSVYAVENDFDSTVLNNSKHEVDSVIIFSPQSQDIISSSDIVTLTGHYDDYQMVEGTHYIIGESAIDAVNIVNLTISENCTVSITGILEVNHMSVGAGTTLEGTGRLTLVDDFNSSSTEAIDIAEVFVQANASFVTLSNVISNIIILANQSKFAAEGDITIALLASFLGESITANSFTLATNGQMTLGGSLDVESCTLHSSSTSTINGSFSSTTLTIGDGSRLSTSNATSFQVSTEVHVLGTAFVDASSDFGNTSTIVDLEFTPGKYLYFTPPFDVYTDDFGTVESDYDAKYSEESVWLFQYNEANEALDASENSWELMSSGETLKAGRGYSIWLATDDVDTKTITLTSKQSYPNLTDLISDHVEYTNDAPSRSGVNALGNTYSLPLNMPEDANVSAYYYYNGEKYVTMSDNVFVGDEDDSILDIPSYSCFYAFVGSADALSFSLSNLSTIASDVRIKSTTSSSEYIRIAVQSDTDYDDAVLRFTSDGTFQHEDSDIEKMFDPNSEAEIEISSALADGTGHYAIQSFPALADLGYNQILDVPFFFDIPKAGVYSISAKLTDITSSFVSPYLYDKLTGDMIKLSSDLTPVTITSDYDRTQRYHIKVFASVTSDVDADSFIESVTAHTSNNILHIRTQNNSSGHFYLLDVSGKKVLQHSFDGFSSTTLSHLPKGMYIVNISLEEQLSKVTKIFVQ